MGLVVSHQQTIRPVTIVGITELVSTAGRSRLFRDTLHPVFPLRLSQRRFPSIGNDLLPGLTSPPSLHWPGPRGARTSPPPPRRTQLSFDRRDLIEQPYATTPIGGIDPSLWDRSAPLRPEGSGVGVAGGREGCVLVRPSSVVIGPRRDTWRDTDLKPPQRSRHRWMCADSAKSKRLQNSVFPSEISSNNQVTNLI